MQLLADIFRTRLILGQYYSPISWQFFSRFYFLRLRQRTHDGYDRSAEDAHFSMAPDLPPIFFRGPCFLCFYFVFFLWTFDFKYCTLSPHFMHQRFFFNMQKKRPIITMFANKISNDNYFFRMKTLVLFLPLLCVIHQSTSISDCRRY